MNRTETAYAEHLWGLRSDNEIVSYRFEAVKLRLADNTFYTPDFMVVTEDEIQFHEVKATKKDKQTGKEKPLWEDDARVKTKVAAEQFPEFRFVSVYKTFEGWQREEF